MILWFAQGMQQSCIPWANQTKGFISDLSKLIETFLEFITLFIFDLLLVELCRTNIEFLFCVTFIKLSIESPLRAIIDCINIIILQYESVIS